MFDFLKKKISGFVSGLSKKEDETPSQSPAPELKQESVANEPKQPIEKDATLSPKENHKSAEEPAKVILEQTPTQTKDSSKPSVVESKKSEKEVAKSPPIIIEDKQKVSNVKIPEKRTTKPADVKPIEQKKPEPKPQKKIEESKKINEPKKIEMPALPDKKSPSLQKQPAQEEFVTAPTQKYQVSPNEDREKERLKLGIVSSVKTLIMGETEIKESDIKDMLDNLELELLEADVDISVSQFIVENLRSKLIGKKVKRGSVTESINQSIKEVLVEVLENDKSFDFIERIRSLPKPVKIVFVGINGAGKTTTIAKVINLLQKNNLRVVVAAADTFRAAAIEQLSTHTDRLGVRLVKRDYGSDPTSVAFDAVNYAKAHSIDVVLIDTAGRQDTNISLINEMKKMVRVISPDLKVYIGESVSGNAIIEQVSSFNKEIGLDGIILTKLDCDPKGGTVLSLNKTSGVPIIFLGIGQKYEDLEVFNSEQIVSRILS